MVFKSNFLAIQLLKLKRFYYKPVCMVFTVLEISKVVMNDVYYDSYIKKKFDENVFYYILTQVFDSTVNRFFYENIKVDINSIGLILKEVTCTELSDFICYSVK